MALSKKLSAEVPSDLALATGLASICNYMEKQIMTGHLLTLLKFNGPGKKTHCKFHLPSI